MKRESRSETIVIKNPSEKAKGFFKQLQDQKLQNREELANKDEFAFTIYC